LPPPSPCVPAIPSRSDGGGGHGDHCGRGRPGDVRHGGGGQAPFHEIPAGRRNGKLSLICGDHGILSWGRALLKAELDPPPPGGVGMDRAQLFLPSHFFAAELRINGPALGPELDYLSLPSRGACGRPEQPLRPQPLRPQLQPLPQLLLLQGHSGTCADHPVYPHQRQWSVLREGFSILTTARSKFHHTVDLRFTKFINFLRDALS